jgi:hypothetical protein
MRVRSQSVMRHVDLLSGQPSEPARSIRAGFLIFALSTACLNLNSWDVDGGDGGTSLARPNADSGVSMGGAGGQVSASDGGGGSGEAGSSGLPAGDAASTADTPTASTCTAGVPRCSSTGSAVEICTVAGDWKVDHVCPAICADGACAGSCTPGDKQCGTEQKAELCSMDGQWMAGVACPFLCRGKGECTGECKPGERKCGEGPALLVPYQCDDQGMWIASPPCANLCSKGSCSGSCPPASVQCGAGNKPESCTAMGTWEPGPACTNQTCVKGACAGVCAPGARQCGSSNNPQNCDGSGLWKDEAGCKGQTCVKGVCQGACAPDDPKRCSPDGKSVQTCGTSGIWMNVDTCGNNGCTAGVCNACRPGGKVCQGKTLRTCNDAGTGWLADVECGLSCDSNALKCINCQPKTETCNGQDDDCDGQIDDGNLCSRNNGTADCRNGRCGNVGCNQGYRECSGNCVADSQFCGGNCGDGYEACNQKCYRLGSLPKELCDGVDNNCSGGVDEGNLCGNGQSCAGSKGCKKASGVKCGVGSECASGTCLSGSPPVGNCSKAIDQECYPSDPVPCKPEWGTCVDVGVCK